MSNKKEFNPNPRKVNTRNIWLVALAIIVIGYLLISILLPIKAVEGNPNQISAPKINLSSIVWPSYGEGAFGIENYGVLATNNEQKSVPIASIAKTILAIMVINEKPLKVGEQGPQITITQKDVDIYSSYLAQNGSVLPVEVNEKLSEYQALQGLLIYSGDNIADTLAIWAFGSVENYLTLANKYLADLGLAQTSLADTCGLSPKTVSSAKDLVKIGETLMANPVLAEIVNTPTVDLPVAGTVNNYNTDLGIDGIVGIKTGTTDEAGGCLLFAAKNTVSGQPATIVGVLLGTPNRPTVLNDTTSFLENNLANISYQKIISKDQVVGSYQSPWGATINAISKEDLSVYTVNGNEIKITVDLNDIKAPLKAGAEVGKITVKSGDKEFTTLAVLQSDLKSPSIFWKILHPKR